VAKIIAGEIVCKIKVVGLRYIVHRMHRLLGMLVITFMDLIIVILFLTWWISVV